MVQRFRQAKAIKGQPQAPCAKGPEACGGQHEKKKGKGKKGASDSREV